jgi:hypothetical protein
MPDPIPRLLRPPDRLVQRLRSRRPCPEHGPRQHQAIIASDKPFRDQMPDRAWLVYRRGAQTASAALIRGGILQRSAEAGQDRLLLLWRVPLIRHQGREFHFSCSSGNRLARVNSRRTAQTAMSSRWINRTGG